MTETFVADTHTLAWYLFNPARLGKGAAAALGRVASGDAVLHIPLVVVAEMAMVIEKGRVAATLTHLEQFLELVEASQNYRIGTLDLQTVLAAVRLSAIDDIFDRLIVAEALAIGGILISRDQNITSANLVPVAW